jgi:hypothetical protein
MASMEAFLQEHGVLLAIVMVLWVLPWKGAALWRAARNGHKVWFVLLLILNTLGILDIVYFLWASKLDKQAE